MSDTNKKILPCPICGNKVYIQKIETHAHVLAKFMPDSTEKVFIECTCGLAMLKDSVEELIMAWNLRVPMKRIEEQLEDEAELSYADFEAYAEEHGLDAENDDFRFGMRRAIEILQKGGLE